MKHILRNLNNRNFRLFAGASLVSGAGNSLVPIAFAIESVSVEPSGWGISLVLILLWSGKFIGMLYYKKYGSVYNPIVIMITSDVFRIIAQSGLLLWIIMAKNNIYVMAASALLYGIAASFFNPSSFVAIPAIIPEEDRVEANALMSFAGDIYSVIGPLAGTSLVLWLGFPAVLLFDTFTFLVSLVLLFSIFLCNKRSCSGQPIKPQVAVEVHSAQGVFHPKFLLPQWTLWGLLSWFGISLLTGFIGVAGPTFIIANYSEVIWAVLAVCIALGSLLGSAASLLGYLKKLSWQHLQLLCSLGLCIQIVALISAKSFSMIVLLGVCGFLASLFATASGIRWDSICQSAFTGGNLHRFSSLDQMVITTAIPLGLVLFGFSSALQITTFIVYLIVVLTCAVTFPLVFYRKISGCPEIKHN